MPPIALESSRIAYLDITRGIAVLGILLMNIIAFGLPNAAYYNPIVDGSDSGLGFVFYAFTFVFAEGTMRALFSILFGASVCMLAEKLPKLIYLRRNLVLLLIGMIDGYLLLWTGDILYDYALLGLLLYFFRQASAKQLLLGAGVIFSLMLLVQTPAAYQLANETPEALQKYQKSISNHYPSPDKLANEYRETTQAYTQLLLVNVRRVLNTQTINFVSGDMWDSLPMMLIGMALFKMGVFSNRYRSRRKLIKLGLMALLPALAINCFELLQAVQSQFAIHWTTPRFSPTYQLGRLMMALFYLCAIFLWVQSSLFTALQQGLAAVGRMALTNYLLQSVIGLLVFSGAGLALYDSFSRPQLYLVVLTCWISMLLASQAWLRVWPQGPVERLWRLASNGGVPRGKVQCQH